MGCPQGSCFGPLLWNIVADEVLQHPQESTVHIQAYADDFALIVSGQSRAELEYACAQAVGICINEFQKLKLQVSMEKSCALVSPSLSRVRRPIFRIGEHRIRVRDSLKYLGLELEPKLTWDTHIKRLRTDAVSALKHLLPLRTGTWGVPLDLLRAWYLTVIEKRLLYGCAIWAPSLATHLWRHLATTQRYLLLLVTKCYRSTSTDALLVLAGIPPIRLTALKYANITRFLSLHLEEGLLEAPAHQRHRYESAGSHIPYHPALATEEAWKKQPTNWNIFTDGTKSDNGVAAAFVVFTHDAVIDTWGVKLNEHNSVFQAELTSILNALHWVRNNDITLVNIHSDSLSSIQAIRNPDHKDTLVNRAQVLLLQKPGASLIWTRAHVGTLGNEIADLLARQSALSNTVTQLDHPMPMSAYKKACNKQILQKWQESWDTSLKGRALYEFVPKVKDKMPFLKRQLLIFFSGHGPYPANLKKQNLITNDKCVCGSEGTRLHYLWDCPLTVQWHMAKPSEENLQAWKLKLAKNYQAHPRIVALTNFLKENELQLREPAPL